MKYHITVSVVTNAIIKQVVIFNVAMYLYIYSEQADALHEVNSFLYTLHIIVTSHSWRVMICYILVY